MFLIFALLSLNALAFASPTANATSKATEATAEAGPEPRAATGEVELMPVGTILPFAGAGAPAGFLICDGSTVSRKRYEKLFSVIGATYGISSQANSFKLPDLRGRTVFGTGHGAGLTHRPLGMVFGAETHTLTVDQMPSHSHGVSDPSHTHPMGNGGEVGSQVCARNDVCHAWALGVYRNHVGVNPATIPSRTGISIVNNGGSQPHNIVPPALSLNYIIKY